MSSALLDQAVPSLILPAGTQVVVRRAVTATGERVGATGKAREERTADAVGASGGELVHPRGAVAEIVATPAESHLPYRLRFPDGTEADVPRRDLAIRKHVQRAGLERLTTAASRDDLYGHVIYRCVIGSRAYGLDDAGSDTDRRGCYLPPADLHWSLAGVPEQLENPDTEECYWELGKFIALALKANPNILECLYTPLVEHATPLARELLAMRGAFLSRLVYQTYNGYVLSQFKRLEADVRTTGAIKWKHAMHLVRLLLSGIAVLRQGEVAVRVGEHRDRLLAIKRGNVPWDEVNAWRLALHRAFDVAYGASALPDEPDYTRANAFLLKARRSMV
jgi:uncharacterized protein